MAYTLHLYISVNGDLLYEDRPCLLLRWTFQSFQRRAKSLGIATIRKQLLRVFELLRSRKRSLYPNTLFKEKHMYLHVYVSIQYIPETRRAHGL
jgi:hypothetical protein